MSCLNFYAINKKEFVVILTKKELEIYKKDYAKLKADIVNINSELEEYKREYHNLLSVIRSLKVCKTKRQVNNIIKDY